MALLVAFPAFAQQQVRSESSNYGYFSRWFPRVDKIQSQQPHWITPLATVTPRLEEEFRYDVDWLTSNNGVTAENYDGGKGLELIPFQNVEVLLNLPPYFVHNNPAIPDGFGDFSFTVKYRLLSANEQRGNYILTAFFGASFPTGSNTNGPKAAILTPTIAYGKGYGFFDVQGTFGVSLPENDTNIIGRTLVWNNTAQIHILKKVWPEIEANSTFFDGGKNGGLKQTFITPGLMIGKIHIVKRIGLTFGGGFQIAVTHFHLNNHNAILSIRFPF
ncbi:MAG TPA: hypothetical protein VKS20_04435 [Candidatus Acidoferrales bacterium]|nr:hypothetical protein [Candidatus Acidoferrales bacterium]